MTLAESIAGEVRAGGPLPFHRFMELALYDADRGYYAGGRDPFGAQGDFYTNAQLQPVFGRLVAQQIDRWRAQLGEPRDFRVLELGPGRGETGAEVQKHLGGLDWIAVEHGESWPCGSLTGVVFCNEFFDALPVDVVERGDGGWIEWGVGLDARGLAWQRIGPAGPRAGLPRIAPGSLIETCERQVAAMGRILRTLRRGWVVVIDYGYTRAEIERSGRFAEGTLMSYARHRADPDVLAEPGRRDITAHVNFSALADAARAAGAEALPLVSQQSFLLEAGRADSFAHALQAASEREATALRLQLKTLLLGLGETFRVQVIRNM